ncbi:HIT family protein [Candidatus Pacearchaeota archaeon]|nr:HIT family protein [Candidatus Pacearchaeota archaeon]
MEECIFCKIVKGEIPSVKIWEDENHLAILDIHPNTEGMTLVLTKKHYDSYIFDLSDETYSKLMSGSKKVAKILEKGLDVKRIAMVFEGQGVNHIHTKLYPMHNVDTNKFGELSGNVYFEKYPGYITTEIGPQKSMEDLKKVAEKIKKMSLGGF